jgi:thioredoxin 1
MMATTIVPEITDATFSDEIGAQSGIALVDFSAEWCAPCRVMAPIIESVAKDYAGTLRVFQMDGDINQTTMLRYGVRGLPTLLVFRDGELVDRILGAIPASALRARIDRIVGAP